MTDIPANSEKPMFDAKDSLGKQPRWKQIAYLIEIGSWGEAFGVLVGRTYAWQR
jgi:hypothetical protein